MLRKQKRKRFMAWVLTIVMVCSLMPANLISFAGPLGMRTLDLKPNKAWGTADFLSGNKTASSSDTEVPVGTSSDGKPEAATSSVAKLANTGTTYYVDAKDGSDTNAGTSEEEPWKSLDKVNSVKYKPGDQILFRAGCTWTGVLKPTGSGKEGAPIVIDKYGEGNKPIFNGNGTKGPAITGTVLIYNEEYWEINNLEVTNYEEGYVQHNPNNIDANKDGPKERAGILIYSSNQEKIYKHIRVKDCYVHDVNSNLQGMKTSGGIIVIGHYMDIDGNVVTIDDNGNLTPKAMGRAAYEDVILEGNYVKSVAVEGIRNKCNTNINGSGWGQNEFLKNFKDVSINNNYLEDVVGDGIVLTETKGGYVEGNMVNKSCNLDRGTINYAQCWTMFADDVFIQFNEVYGSKYGYDDGEAFDSDMKNINNIFQYNLSHDNGGGACLFMSNQVNTIFRYNVSINDGGGTIVNNKNMQQQIFHYDSTTANSPSVPQIYNNTIYANGTGFVTSLFGGKSARTSFLNFRNNIVLAENGAKVTFSVPAHTDINGSAVKESLINPESIIENNCIYPREIADTNGVSSENLLTKNNIFEDPLLSDPTAGLDYSAFVLDIDAMGEIYGTQERVAELSKPYQLSENSPCIRKGQLILGAPEKDMFGNGIAGRVDIGAHEFSSAEIVVKADDVTIMTTPSRRPQLPETTQVVFEDSAEAMTYPVIWDTYDNDIFDQAGIVNIGGRLKGMEDRINAKVIVSDTPTEMDKIEVTTHAGIYPQLPKTIMAKFGDDVELELKVRWDTIPLENYKQEGTFVTKGTVNGLADKINATVTVTGKSGDGKTTVNKVVKEDAYIQMGSGTPIDTKLLKIKPAKSADYNRRSLVKFDITDQKELIKEATKIAIKVYTTRFDSQSEIPLRIYNVDNNWAEGSVNWNSAPAVNESTPVAFDEVVRKSDVGTILEFDITDYVKKTDSDELSFLMGIFATVANPDNTGFDFESKENGAHFGPTLVISNVYEKQTNDIEVVTSAGISPTLPKKVTIIYTDDTTKEVDVVWDSIDKSEYAQGGIFTVEGSASGVSIPIIATVTVKKAPLKIASVKELEPITAAVGTKEEDLGLPKTVVAVLENGQEMVLPIKYWFPEPAYNPSNARSYSYVGHFDLEQFPSISNANTVTAGVSVTLVETVDKNILITLYQEATLCIDNGEADNQKPAVKEAFMKAYEEAGKILKNLAATEAEVQSAYDKLMEAIWDFEEVLPTGVVTGIIVSKEPTKIVYNLNEVFDPTGIIVLAQYSDNKVKPIDAADYTIETVDTSSLGTKSVEVSYETLVNGTNQTFTASFNITVKEESTPEAVVTGIKVTKQPEKMTYQLGEPFDPNGMEVAAVYSDLTERVITNYQISKVNTTLVGEKTVTILYDAIVEGEIKEFKDSFTITVVDSVVPEPEIVSITVSKMPNKTSYKVGETFDSTGLEVSAVYNDTTKKVITGYQLSAVDMGTAGTKEIIVTYTASVDGAPANFTATFNIEVFEEDIPTATVTGIKVTKLPTKTIYVVGEAFDSSGLEIAAIYSDQSERAITGYIVGEADTSTAGVKEVTVSYTTTVDGVSKTFTANFSISVKEPEVPEAIITGIKVTKMPEKISYAIGETLNTKGLEVTAVYSDMQEKVITDYTVSQVDTSTAGTKEVVVSYTIAIDGADKTFTAKFDITVREADVPEAVVTGIKVTKLPSKTTYKTGETFDPAGLEVVEVFSDGAEKAITEFKLSKVDMLTEGTKEVVVSYTTAVNGVNTTFDASFSILVEKDIVIPTEKVVGIRIVKQPDKTLYKVGEAFSAAGLKVAAVYNTQKEVLISDYKVSTVNTLSAGTKTVTVTYTVTVDGEPKSFTADFRITVKKPTPIENIINEVKDIISNLDDVLKDPSATAQDKVDAVNDAVGELAKVDFGQGTVKDEVMDAIGTLEDTVKNNNDKLSSEVDVQTGKTSNVDTTGSILSIPTDVDGAAKAVLVINDTEVPDKSPVKLDNEVALDITLNIQSADGTVNETGIQPIVPIKVTMDIPKGVNKQDLLVLHYHENNSNGAIIPSKVNGNKVSFTITSLSTFVLANKATGTNTGTSGGSDSGSSNTASTGLKGQWIMDSNGWWFKKTDNTYPKGDWAFINNVWYHFDTAGYMQTGWILVGDGQYYLLESGNMAANSWVQTNNQWYYLGGNGRMLTNQWIQTKDKWFYVNNNGEMVKNTQTPDGFKVNENGEWIQ